MFLKQLITQVLTALLGVNGKEFAFGGVIAAIGTTAISALGGWNITLQLLLFCMLLDFITGILAAIKAKHKVDSDIMLWGGVRKIIVLLVIWLAGMLDTFFISQSLLGNQIIQTAAYFFYLGREGLSLVENLGKLNVLVPDIVKDKLAQLKDYKQGERHEAD